MSTTSNDIARKTLRKATQPLAWLSKDGKSDLNHWIDYRFPPSSIYQITFRAADGCNLRCKTCHFSLDYRKGQKTLLMDPQLVKDVVDKTKGFVNLCGFSGSGEPLINPRIHEMIQYVTDAGIRSKIGTNVMLLTEDMSERLLKAGLSILKVSIDGATAETYETVRVGASFEKLKRNLEFFWKLRNEMGAKTRIHVNTVITNDNQHEVDDVKKVFGHVADKFAAKFPTTFGIMGNLCEYSPSEMTNKKCNQLVKRMTIVPDGGVSICCGDNQNNGIIGNVHDNTALEIWNSPLYNEWRGYHRTGQTDKIPLCSGCLRG
jgi:sulfatase maturation enzyme AslB (radical SAM superfamily)|tara:strand:+ start:207 stop:1160 length:954 start_codon:yes stop_codon:yes gene_type:complete